jgi:hypothetical protein
MQAADCSWPGASELEDLMISNGRKLVLPVRA